MAWQKKLLVQYQNMLNNVKEKTMKPSFIFEGVKTSWQQQWSNPEHRRLSQENSANCCSGVDGRPSIHTSVSATHVEVSRVGMSFHSGGGVPIYKHPKSRSADFNQKSQGMRSSMYFECNTRNPSTGRLSLATSTINNCIIKQLVERKREGYTTSDPRRLAFTDLLPLVA
ncbi:hypothetical protein Fot_06391 [Forsythia ovata]|uniref:Uncharacterized protein n=1 Tax=Forsythia ovata TaxID=205694 RepID=A0ABD1WSU7_9LAMI